MIRPVHRRHPLSADRLPLGIFVELQGCCDRLFSGWPWAVLPGYSSGSMPTCGSCGSRLPWVPPDRKRFSGLGRRSIGAGVLFLSRCGRKGKDNHLAEILAGKGRGFSAGPDWRGWNGFPSCLWLSLFWRWSPPPRRWRSTAAPLISCSRCRNRCQTDIYPDCYRNLRTDDLVRLERGFWLVRYR